MLIALWFLSGLVGGLGSIIMINKFAGIPSLKLSDLVHVAYITFLGPLAIIYMFLIMLTLGLVKLSRWLVAKNNGNDITLIP